MKKSTIKAATFDKSFTSKFGTLYQHSITLSNGDSGQLNAKEEMPGWIHPGQTLYYDSMPNGKYPDKIKRITDKNLIEQFDKGNGGAAPEASNSTELQVLKDEISKLKEVVKQLSKHTKLVYVAPKQEKPNNTRSEYASEAASDELDKHVGDDDDLPF